MNLLGIYHGDIPSFILDIAATEPVGRLRKVGMNCGCEYCRTLRSRHVGFYSRYEHSIGAALIVWHFTGDVRQSVSALLHDVATPAFAHSIDFLHGDYMKQESTEATTLDTIKSCGNLTEKLARLGLEPEDVSDYHLFPIADNDTPRLSSDRLEYTVGNSVNYGFAGMDDMAGLYGNLISGINEEGDPEIVFRDLSCASEFASLALSCSKVYVSDEDRYTMQMLAELLKAGIDAGTLAEQDLWGTEESVIGMLKADPASAARWEEYCAIETVTTGIPGPCARKINAKKRYIDPFVLGRGRVSDLDGDFRARMDEYLGKSFDYWVSVP